MAQRVAVIGGGSVGSALARGLSGTSHDVVVGVRDPSDPRHDPLRPHAAIATPADAAARSDTVIAAVPAAALGDSLRGLGLRSGQVLIDATNAVGIPVPDGHETMGDYAAAVVPAGVAVVKAFNTIGAEHLADGRVDGQRAFLPIAGDAAGRSAAEELATDLGFEVADLGDREAFGMMEAHAQLWIHLAFACGWGRDFGFAVVRR